MPPAISYCVVNTNGREHVLACLNAIRSTHPDGLEHEVLVLDNASDDGSKEAARAWMSAARTEAPLRLIDSERRRGKAENDSRLLEAASAPLCLLLNEDSELRPGAAAALVEALRIKRGNLLINDLTHRLSIKFR